MTLIAQTTEVFYSILLQSVLFCLPVFFVQYSVLIYIDIVYLILQVYFGYVEYGLVTLKKETTPHSLKVFLEEEWAFSKEICPFITGGMAEAGKRFW
mgnify:CR=1 FL=1